MASNGGFTCSAASHRSTMAVVARHDFVIVLVCGQQMILDRLREDHANGIMNCSFSSSFLHLIKKAD